MYAGLYAFHVHYNFVSNIRNFIERTHALGDDRLPIRGYRAGRGPEGYQVSENVPWSFEILTVHFRVPARRRVLPASASER